MGMFYMGGRRCSTWSRRDEDVLQGGKDVLHGEEGMGMFCMEGMGMFYMGGRMFCMEQKGMGIFHMEGKR